MNYQVIRLLQREEAAGIVSNLKERTFADGKLTAYGFAREVKNNLQIERTGPELDEIDRLVIGAFQRSAEFQSFALPRRLVTPMFSRYDPGMEYGAHVDGAMMGGFSGVRADLAVTLFLSPPATYDGGELVIQLSIGEEEIKLDAGEAIVYPASTIHHVAPVTRGVRFAAITWVQSVVRDERLRAILYDLGLSTKQAEQANAKDLTLLLSKSYHNLLRYAAEP